MKIARILTSAGETVVGLLESNGGLRELKGGLFEVGEHRLTGRVISQSEIDRFLPPVDPPNIFAIGLNYQDHAAETNMTQPDEPVIFLKATTALIGHGQPVIIPPEAPTQVDYEAELAVVIGKQARNISPERALDYVLGYTCANDVTARDCQMQRDRQWARAKSFDTFCPVGPVIVTDLDPGHLTVTSRLNGEVMQSGSTADLIFDVPFLVSFLSRCFTLLPGTLILSGTPPGVGVARDPQVFMGDGDRIEVTIDGIGTLKNPVCLHDPSSR